MKLKKNDQSSHFVVSNCYLRQKLHIILNERYLNQYRHGKRKQKCRT